MPDLSADHEHAAATCLAKTGHHPESRAAERLTDAVVHALADLYEGNAR